MDQHAKIPVFVLTGFLGSGKTVLLNSLLGQPGFSDTAVVVNEFGEIGLDHLLVGSSQENIVLLDAGCLCCAILGSLKETLADLFQRRARGEVPEFRRVIIETTGLADPGPILRSIMRDNLVAPFFRLAGTICVVDAVFGAKELAEHPEARLQVAVADRMVISKTDIIGTCPDEVTNVLRALNPGGEMIIASHGQVPATALLGDDDNAAAHIPWLGELAAPKHDHAGPHDQAVTAECFWIDRPATQAGVAAWIDVVRRRHGPALLRCKGILEVVGQARPMLLHGVQTVFETRLLPAWPDGHRRARLVLIGKCLERQALLSTLAWLHVPEGTQPPLDALEQPTSPAGMSDNL